MLDNWNGWESLDFWCFGEVILIMRWCGVYCDNRAKDQLLQDEAAQGSTNYQLVEKTTVVSEIDSKSSRNRKLKG